MMQPIRMRTAIEMRLFTSGKASSSSPVLVLKVSATLQDRPREDRLVLVVFIKTPINHIFFKSLIVPDYGFELTKTIYLNVFRNWNALCKRTRLYKSCSVLAGNKRKKTINTAFASQHVLLDF